MSWYVVVNPTAGRGRPLSAEVRRLLQASAIDHELAVSATPDDVRRLVHAAVADGHRDFAGVGGDGTAHLVLNALMTSGIERPTLAILPAGSGSDFIRTFALPRTLEGAVEHLRSDDRYDTDVGIVHGAFGTRYFLNALNVGVAASSVVVGDRLPKRLGGLRYRAGFWLALPGFRPTRGEVRVDHHRFNGEVMNVVVANGQFFGGGLNIAPRASVTDGVFDVQCFAGPRRNAFSVMPRVVRGGHLTLKSVRRYVGGSIEIDVPADWPVEADGELLGSGSVRVEVVPGALQFKI